MPITQQSRTCPEYVRFWIPSTIEETDREREREGEGKEKDKQRHRHRGHRDTETETSERGRETERKRVFSKQIVLFGQALQVSHG